MNALPLLLSLALSQPAPTPPQDSGPVVRVFVLAGQSNMEGKAQDVLWERQAEAEGTREFFAHLRDGDAWAVRDDVFVEFLGRRGPLTLGFGSPGRTGVELELGTVLGEAFDEPVLLIKACWGGHSLFRSFRPPSAGVPAERVQADLEQAIERTKKRNEEQGRDDPLPTEEDVAARYGESYRNLLSEVRTTLAELDERCPALAEHEPRLDGFVWFQGWNDQYEGAEVEYEENLLHLIRDVRRDLEAPALPFVIGVMGQNMSKPAEGAMKVIQDAQLAARDALPHVRSVRTDVLVDEAAEALYPTWRENREEWDRTGSDHPYHYLGSAIWMTRIGRALAAALLEELDR